MFISEDIHIFIRLFSKTSSIYIPGLPNLQPFCGYKVCTVHLIHYFKESLTVKMAGWWKVDIRCCPTLAVQSGHQIKKATALRCAFCLSKSFWPWVLTQPCNWWATYYNSDAYSLDKNMLYNWVIALFTFSERLTHCPTRQSVLFLLQKSFSQFYDLKLTTIEVKSKRDPKL